MDMTRRDSIQALVLGTAALSVFRPSWSGAEESNSKSIIRIAFNENPDGPTPSGESISGRESPELA